MTRENHDMSALTGAYALDALAEDERAAFEAHLVSCGDCADEVRSLRAAAGELSHAVSLAPPPQVRANILGAIEGVRPLAPARDSVRSPRLHRGMRGWSLQAVAATCILLAVAGGVYGYTQRQNALHAQSRAVALSRVLDSPDARLVATKLTSGRATIIYSKAEHRLVLTAHDVPAQPDGKTYQLWMIGKAGHATSAGVFAPDTAGMILIEKSAVLPDTTHIAVSVEPAGGSAQPTPGAVIADTRV